MIVRRGKNDLLELLRSAFHRRGDFTVIMDRRESAGERDLDRRTKHTDWNGHDFFVAERVTLLD